jgi:glycosyltransferase involved in cell wall biosynthesis
MIVKQLVPVEESIQLSIVIPLFNEEGAVTGLVEEIIEVVSSIELPHEVILVDDGSSDNTKKVLSELEKQHTSVRGFYHRKNYGQSAGLATGFSFARGNIIITLDGDGQNDPADILLLIEKLTDDVDCVCGMRHQRQDGLVKRISSRIANRLRDITTGVSFADAGCALRAVRREALDELIIFNGMHRFLPSILRLQGYHVVEIPVGHRPRLTGVSKYGISNRLFRGLLDCFALRWYKARVFQGRRLG